MALSQKTKHSLTSSKSLEAQKTHVNLVELNVPQI